MSDLERVLVTGGTGVIGAYVTRHLADRGITPIVFTRGRTDEVGGAINADIEDQLVAARGDMLDGDSLRRAITDHRAQAIVHMASAKPWQIEVPFVEESDPDAAIEQIGVGTLRVLEAARATGVTRVVYASSKGVFDDVRGPQGPPDYQPLSEDYPRNPHLLYGVGKVLAENLGEYFADQYGLEFVSIRFAASYGPLKRGPTARSVEGLLESARAGGPVEVRPFVDGQREDYVYNRDVAEAFVLAALAPTPAHRHYNIGSGTTSDHHDLVRMVRTLYPDVETIVQNEGDVRRQGPSVTDRARCLMDISRARTDLGYEPRWPGLVEGAEDYVREMQRIRGPGGPSEGLAPVR